MRQPGLTAGLGWLLSAVSVLTACDPVGIGAESTEPDSATERARRMLATGLKVDAGAVELQSYEQVDWADSSLGCPKAGMSYLQVITPGYRIYFDVAGRPYAVHGAGERQLICEAVKPETPTAIAELGLAEAFENTRGHLAERLGVATTELSLEFVNAIDVARARALCWPDQPGAVITNKPMFHIGFEWNRRAYSYVVGLGKPIPCEEMARE